MQTNVDNYFHEGCGRCELGGTPDCKVHLWKTEMAELRNYILETNLEEESKWGVPCYTFQGKNVLILSAFKNYCSVSFFKGALLSDEQGKLHKPGENSQAARLFKFTNLEEIIALKPYIIATIFEAIENEKAGREIEFNKQANQDVPEELAAIFEVDDAAKAAFEALTPGRKRSYIIHITGAKQEKTRISRAEKCIPKILTGKGFNEY